MNKPSISRVNGILQCPRKYHEVEFETSEALAKGLRLHTLLENYIKYGVIDEIMSSTIDKDFIKKLKDKMDLSNSDSIFSEVALDNDNFKGFIDLVLISKRQLSLWDLKVTTSRNQKNYDVNDSEQLDMYAHNLVLDGRFEGMYDDIFVGYILYLKDKNEFVVDYKQIGDLSDRIKLWDKKVKLARFILDNELYIPMKNEYCKYCKLRKEGKCK